MTDTTTPGDAAVGTDGPGRDPGAGSRPGVNAMVRSFFLAAALFIGAAIVGLWAPPGAAADMMEQLVDVLGPLSTIHPLWILIIILLNNSIKALAVVLLGVLVGLPPFFFVVFNGWAIGMVIAVTGSETGSAFIVAALAPHGIIELPLIWLSSAVGFLIGRESLRWLFRRPSRVKEQVLSGLKTYLNWILPGLILASIIEVLVTPLIIRAVEGG